MNPENREALRWERKYETLNQKYLEEKQKNKDLRLANAEVVRHQRLFIEKYNFIKKKCLHLQSRCCSACKEKLSYTEHVNTTEELDNLIKKLELLEEKPIVLSMDMPENEIN